MYNFYLIGLSEVSKDQSLVNDIMPSIADRFQVGLQTVALGMLIVLSVLATLWIILEIVGRIAAKKTADVTKKVKTESTESIEPSPVVSQEISYENDEEIVAAITAAISLMLEAENAPVKGFRVVSFKRASNSAHWNR